MATTAIVGEKVGMTQVWDEDNRMVRVTVVSVAPLRIVSIRTPERDGYSALQVTFGNRKATRHTKPVAGQYAKAGVDPGVRLVELRLDDVTGYEVGQEITVDKLSDGDLVDVTAVSKGEGFAGVMKRHGPPCDLGPRPDHLPLQVTAPSSRAGLRGTRSTTDLQGSEVRVISSSGDM